MAGWKIRSDLRRYLMHNFNPTAQHPFQLRYQFITAQRPSRTRRVGQFRIEVARLVERSDGEAQSFVTVSSGSGRSVMDGSHSAKAGLRLIPKPLPLLRIDRRDLRRIYDNLGRLQSVDNLGTPGAPRVVMTYSYDANGNTTRVQDSLGGSTDYSYDALDRLSRVTQSGAGVQPKLYPLFVGRACRVSFVDEHGTRHIAEVVADSLYEAALAGLKAISQTWAEEPGINTPISVSIVPVEHQVTLRQIKIWVEKGAGTPKEMAQRYRLKELLQG